MSQLDTLSQAERNWGILLISVVGLFLEMLLIRWIGTEIRIFAYLQNTVLVACFLGLGLGCFTCRQPIVLRRALLPLGALVLLLAIPYSREFFSEASRNLSVLGDFLIWDQAVAKDLWQTTVSLLVGLAATFVILLLVLDIFAPIGRLLGRLMDDSPNTIAAYSINVAGSLLGTWLFVLLGFLYWPPFAWFAVLTSLGLIFWWRVPAGRRGNLSLVAGIVVLSWFAGQVPGAMEVIWSPYQKLVLSEGEEDSPGDLLLAVNNTGYQAMIDLSERRVAGEPDKFPADRRGLSQYDIPLLLHPRPESALFVGAGSGNDAAGGLRNSVERITAVEIDPAIIALGRRYHPERPYSVPDVQVVNDDARSFFAKSTQKYDVIAFGLLDSHTSTAMTNARLDHYVYTQESIARAHTLMADGGIMALSFEAQKPFITDRMARVLRDEFGEEPMVFRIPPNEAGWGGVMFISGDLAAAREQIAGNPGLETIIARWQSTFPQQLSYTTNVTTDDWPYIYLESPRVPTLYLLLVGLMLLLFWRSYRVWGAAGLVGRWGRSHWHFFFLGAAFLLLEVQNISKAAVVLGNTWDVNAVIVSSVLVMILCANLVASRLPRLPMLPVFGLLVGICLLLYVVDLAQFAFLPYAQKALVVGGLTSLPMLFSGIIFIRSFAATPSKNDALGANLIGALAGALLQSITFVTGIKALLLVVAAFYVLSLVTRPHSANATTYPSGSSA